MPQSSDDNRIFGRRYALCVGIGTYTNLANHTLRYAVADAKIIAERLEKGGDFAVTCLTEPGQTSKAALDEAIEELLSAPDRQAEDLIVIYFSCHGTVSTLDNTFCLLPSDAALQAKGMYEQTTLIGIYDIARWFSKARVQNIVMLLDVCHSGGAGAALQHFEMNLSTGLNYFIIGGARQDQVARQSSPLQHGFFTHCLLRAFEQPAAQDGWLTISQIHTFVSDEISWYYKGQPIQIQGLSVSVNPNLPLLRNLCYPEHSPLPPLWNVPLQRNLCFTGQDDLLSQLANMLQSEQKTALTQPQTISGLGGIGKTQLAVEYAYRHRQDYHAVLWARADTREDLIASFVTIASDSMLALPQKDEKDQMIIVEAVKAWLAGRSKWLLILDNADELALVKEFIPPAFRGHLLLTTRTQTMGGLAHKLEVKVMSQESGALLLLRRSRLVAPRASLEDASPLDVALAKEITEELGGLPLALDQAGAYIEETQCRLAGYRDRYRTRSTKLLRRRGGLVGDHPESVATTLSLSFEKVEQRSLVAADILRLCAYLAPDVIPEEIVTQGIFSIKPGQEEKTFTLMLQTTSSREENTLILDEAIAVLGAYSLIHRDRSNNVISLHRLVQAVLRESIVTEEKTAWKARVVIATHLACPNVEDVAQWDACERWLPHALACTVWIEQQRSPIPRTGSDVVFSGVSVDASLLHAVGYYLRHRGRYAEAEPLLKQALAIAEQELGPTHPDTATSLDSLAMLYCDQGKYTEAEPLLKRALETREQELGPTHLDTAQSLNSLAILYYKQGKYAEVELLLQRALTIGERELGPTHLNTGMGLNNLAVLYQEQRKYSEAEPLYQRALAIVEQVLGPTHPGTAMILSNLAVFYQEQRKYAEAESLNQRALAIDEQELGLTHPDTVRILNNLANLYQEQRKYSEAELVLKQALAIREQELGPTHPGIAGILNNLALLYQKQRKYAEAEPLYQRALAIDKQENTAAELNNLADLYKKQGKYAEAEPLLKQALTVAEQSWGLTHLMTAVCLNNLAMLYQNQRKYAEAEPLIQRALAIAEQALGPTHPNTQTFNKNYTSLLRTMRRKEKPRRWKRILDLFSR